MFLASKLLIRLHVLLSIDQLKIKESFHIERLKPELNKQVDHVSLALHLCYVSCIICNIIGSFEFYLHDCTCNEHLIYKESLY